MKIKSHIRSDKEKKGVWKVLYDYDGIKNILSSKKLTRVTLSVFAFYCLYSFIFMNKRKKEFIQPKTEILSTDLFSINEVTQHEKQEKESSKKIVIRGSKVKKKTMFLGSQIIERRRTPVPIEKLIKVKLLTGASEGYVEALVSESLILEGEELLSQGSILIGDSKVQSSERILINFHKIKTNDGSYKKIKAMAFDLSDKSVGVKVSQSLKRKIVRSTVGIGLNVVSGMADSIRHSRYLNNVASGSREFQNHVLSGVSQSALHEGDKMIAELKQSSKGIRIPPGTRLFVKFMEEL